MFFMGKNNSNKHEKIRVETPRGLEALEKIDGDLGRAAESRITRRTEGMLDTELVGSDGIDDSSLRRAFHAGMSAEGQVKPARRERPTEVTSGSVVRDAVKLGEEAIEFGGSAIGLTIEMMTDLSDNAK